MIQFIFRGRILEEPFQLCLGEIEVILKAPFGWFSTGGQVGTDVPSFCLPASREFQKTPYSPADGCSEFKRCSSAQVATGEGEDDGLFCIGNEGAALAVPLYYPDR